MKVFIGAVGRLKSGPTRELCADYLKRFEAQGRSIGMRDIEVREVSESNRRNTGERRDEEAAALLSLVPHGAPVIALDERGSSLESREFANRLLSLQSEGFSNIAFLIGGPDGHGDAVRASARQMLSFGAMTWPHMLVRTMLAEQLYRAVTILTKHPYHRQ